jgi:hypothetical protein
MPLRFTIRDLLWLAAPVQTRTIAIAPPTNS